MAEDTCVPLNVDMNSCEPKRICCGPLGAVAYNKFGACPLNQGYTVNNEVCQCCRPPCTPKDHRVTFTVHRIDWDYQTCISGDNCTVGGDLRTWAGTSITKTVDGISNPYDYRVDIQNSSLFGPFVCNCYVGTSDPFGHYNLLFDYDCPTSAGDGWSFIQWEPSGAVEGPMNGWSVEAAFYHTIDLIEKYVNGLWVPV